MSSFYFWHWRICVLMRLNKGAFSGCSSLTSIIIPDSVTSIGGGAFSGCDLLVYNEYDNAYYLGNDTNKYVVLIKAKTTSIVSCNINDSCKIIYSSAFDGCRSITSITIPDSVTSIDNYAFRGCSSLTSITIPDSVTSIGERAFDGCSSLTSITIGNGVTSIGESAFYNCSSLTSITIPDGVTSIGYGAFEYCNSLKTVFYKGTAEQWSKISINSSNGYLENATKVYNYDDITRNYSFVTNCEQTIEPISAKYIETLPVITRNDYYFGGWYDNAELNGTPVNEPYYSKEKTTLYAKWWTEEEWNELHNGTSFDKAFIAESGKSYTVNITSGGQIVYFTFTATASKSYTIQSTGSGDTYGTLYSSSKSSLSTDDDSGSGSNFSITYSMSASNTYYVAVKFYRSSTTGSFTVQFS